MISIHPLTDQLIEAIDAINSEFGWIYPIDRHQYEDIQRKLFKSGEDDGYYLYKRLEDYMPDIDMEGLNKLDEIVQEKRNL